MVFVATSKLSHPVQVPRCDVPRWLPRSIILLKVPPQSQIMSPQPIKEKVLYPGHKETFSLVIFLKNWWSPLKYIILGMILGLWNNYANWLMRFLFKSSAMETWHLISLIIHLNLPGFLENFSASCSLQQLQMKSSRNGFELKWLILRHKYLEK